MPAQNINNGVSAIFKGRRNRAFADGRTETLIISPGFKVDKYVPVTPLYICLGEVRDGVERMLYVIVHL